MTEEIRPDVGYSITRNRERYDDYLDDDNLEDILKKEDEGFVCHNCGWRNISLPLNIEDDFSLDEGFKKDICPECGSDKVENKLSTHIENINEVIDEYEDDWVPYQHIENRFTSNRNRLDQAINYLLSHDRLYVIIEDGEAKFHN